MVGKKQNTKSKKVTDQETVQETVQVTVQETVQVMDKEQVMEQQVSEHESKKLPGRTLLIKSTEPLDLSVFDNMDGLVNKSEINQHNSIFLTFDTIKNSESAFALLSHNYNVKYSYYKIFFTLSSSIDNSNYNQVKNQIMNYIESNTNSNMLYFKVYYKNSSYMNCGDLVVDTIDSMKKLISKESELKQFKTENFSGTFFRFNNSKYKTMPKYE